ncbi:MAG: RNA polymerase sigma factor [Bacteroidota bacterium]
MYGETLLDIAMMHSDSVIDRAQNGDKEAFNQLVSLWYKRIYNYAYKYFSEHNLASEATQKTFILVYRKIDSLKNPDSFKGWIYRIATNCCHEEERLRKVNSNSEPIDLELSAKDRRDDQVGVEDKIVNEELSEVLIECLGQINPEQRQVIIMKEYEGFKFREIAEVLDISENTAKSRLYYGLAALRKILEEKNITIESWCNE